MLSNLKLINLGFLTLVECYKIDMIIKLENLKSTRFYFNKHLRYISAVEKFLLSFLIALDLIDFNIFLLLSICLLVYELNKNCSILGENYELYREIFCKKIEYFIKFTIYLLGVYINFFDILLKSN